jgi:cystathionine gamma-synthase
MMDESFNGVIPGIYPSTTYEREADGSYPNGRVYTRDQNPNYDQPEQVLSSLEKGADAMLFSSGMAAAVTVFQGLKAGDHIIAPKVMYWALRSWLLTLGADMGLQTTFVKNGDVAAVKAAVVPGKTKLLWMETPANPTWVVDDIAAWSAIAKDAGAILAVDNTVATPVLTRPIEHGADIVMHSATKYLNGHFEAWLLMRGMRTLHIRVKQACQNALKIATALQDHPDLEAVLYPGLPSDPAHEISARQMSGGFGGMMSIRVKGGEKASMDAAARLQLFKRATSLGGVESLVEHRASIEGEGTPCPPDLLRLSIGIEDADDLIADLKQALENK